RAVGGDVPGRAAAPEVHVGDADDDGAGVAEEAEDRGLPGRQGLALAAVARTAPGQPEHVLDRYRDAVERARRRAAEHALGLVREAADDRVERAVALLDP